MKTPLQKIAEAAAEAAYADVIRLHDEYERAGESPIEKLFFCALRTQCSIHGGFRVLSCATGETLSQESIDIDHTMSGVGEDPLWIERQTIYAGYRVDFAIKFKVGNEWRLLIVECDGHEFHERTKQQAAKDRSRDRAIQALGHPIFRFTGAEIYRDPMSCADQALSMIEGLIRASYDR